MRHAWMLTAGLAAAIPLMPSCGSSSGATAGTGGGACGPDMSNPDETLPGASDPAKGVFTLDEALAGLPDGPGPLRALIDTDKGLLTCPLEDAKVPNAVANFVGLARGLRPWRD